MNSSGRYYLNIAGIIFLVQTDDERLLLSPEPGVQHFLTGNEKLEHDILINVKTCKPDTDGFVPVFRTNQSDILSANWTVFGNQDRFFLHSVVQSLANTEVFAFFDLSFKTWNIFVSQQGHEIILLDPMTHPFGTIILLYSTLIYGGIMVHASAIRYKNKGFIFCGFSGAGKSTIATIFSENGAELINDDRIILRNIKGDVHIFNTPMPYIDVPKSNQLDACFFLEKKNTNQLHSLSMTKATARLTASCLQHNFHKKLIQNQLKNSSAAAGSVLSYMLGFYPDKNIIAFIEENFPI